MPQNYRPGLDVVRLAALLPVLCYHYCIEAARLGFAVPTALIGRGMADWVEVGLAWFFLLSGAALCLQWQGRFDARRYFVGRAAATYPAFWLGFGALFLYGEVLHGNNADIPRWRVIFSVLGLDGYLAPVTVTFYKIGEWFLGVILILYLVFPLLLRCMETAARRRVLALCMAVLAVVWPLVCPAPWEAGHTVLGRLPAFALGVWFGSLLQQNAAPPKWLVAGLLALPLLPGQLLPHGRAETLAATEAETAPAEPADEPFDGAVTLRVLVDGAVCEQTLHDYLVCVLLAEVPSGFAAEALKAQACAARTFALRQAGAGKHAEADVCASAACCLIGEYNKFCDINLGTGMVVIGLASLIIGETLFGRGGMWVKAVAAVAGSVIYRFIIALALRANVPSECLKLISAVIVALAIAAPALKAKADFRRRRANAQKGGARHA